MKKINDFIKNIILSVKILFSEDLENTLLILLCSIIMPINSIIMTYIMKWSIDFLSESNNGNFSIIFLLLFGYFFAKVINVILSNVENYSNDVLNNKVRCFANKVIIDKCFCLDMSLYDDAEMFNEIQYVHNHYDSIYKIYVGTIQIIAAIISCIIILLSAFDNMMIFCIIIIISCIPAGIAKLKYNKTFYELSMSQIQDERKLDYLISLVLNKSYAQELRQHSAEKTIFKMHKEIWLRLIGQRKSVLRKSLFASTILLFLPETSYLIMMFIIAKKIFDDLFTIGDFSLYLGLITQIWGDINRIMYEVDSLIEDNRIIDVLRKFLKKESSLKNGNKKIKEIKKVEFINVCFKYPNSDEYIIENMNFVISAGDTIAIVGENGVGKSTIIKLMLRFYDVNSGKILINGLNIKTYNIYDLRKCLGIYFQNGMNYAFQIKDNITFDEEKDEKLMYESAEISEFSKVMEKKELSFENYITKLFAEEGIELSGGEHQRLALARAVYSGKNWFIFDEPSSALDPKSEYEFFQKIRNISKEKTVIYISHRLTNISFSDKILVISGGKVIESGDIEYLMQTNGKFFELYNYQKSMYQ